MTKQHFIAFASEIRNRFNLTPAGISALPPAEFEACNAVIDSVSNVARQFNPKFDEARFRKACFAK